MRSEVVDSAIAGFVGIRDIDFDASYRQVSGTNPGIRLLGQYHGKVFQTVIPSESVRAYVW
jgi:hypothetical protein